MPPGYVDGHAVTAPVVEMLVYLGYLLDRFAGSGGDVEHRAVSSLEEIGEEASVVVNCADLGTPELAGDPSMEPVTRPDPARAHPGLERFVLHEENQEGVTYLVPHSEDCILGGTTEKGE